MSTIIHILSVERKTDPRRWYNLVRLDVGVFGSSRYVEDEPNNGVVSDKSSTTALALPFRREELRSTSTSLEAMFMICMTFT